MKSITSIGLISSFLLVIAYPVVAEETASEQLTQLFKDSWEYGLTENPLWASRVGDHRHGDKLPRTDLSSIKRRAKMKQDFLDRLKKINRSQLNKPQQANYDIFHKLLLHELEEFRFKSYLIPITNRSGFHISFPELYRHVPLKTIKDYENYIARLNQFKQYAADHIELMREGIKQQRTLPSIVLEGFQETITPHIVIDPQQSMLYEPFRQLPATFSDDQQTSLKQKASKAITDSVVAGYQDFLTFMKKEYLPSCRGSIGVLALSDGRDYYRFRVQKYTTLSLTPEQVHQIGLREVARIKGEMNQIIQRVKFKGDFAAFIKFLRTDPQFYTKTPEELMKEIAYVLKKMDGKLPELFGRLPKTPYGIREVPAFIAPKTTTAYYQRPTGDGTQAGFYFVNTYNLKSRPLYEIEALSLHEAVPGHHLQIALQQELTGLPNFRRYSGFTAFVEGWGLYSERLGLEVGFYKDPYRDFGRLTYEMWRACRLVVDTGIHHYGWTRQQAIDYMAGNTALALHNIRAEVDRYIAWPGQAVAYKIGELKIRELRKRAEKKLGDSFDIRKFHDTVLGSGSVPLSLLEENVDRYINEQLKN